jgi:hypothetical protein
MYRVDGWGWGRQWGGVLCVLVGMREHNVDALTHCTSSQPADDLVRLSTASISCTRWVLSLERSELLRANVKSIAMGYKRE